MNTDFETRLLRILDALDGRYAQRPRLDYKSVPAPRRPKVPRPPRLRVSGVYFVQAGDRIKIGMGVCIASRIGDLQVGSASRLKCLGYIECFDSMVSTERELHTRFAGLRLRGEWFRDDPELRAFIATHAKPWPLHPDDYSWPRARRSQ